MLQLRELPKVDELARHPALAAFPEAIRMEACRSAVDELRSQLLSRRKVDVLSAPELAVQKARRFAGQTHRAAINMSGVVLHTGLGRARLAQSATDEMASIATGHSFIELDEETGQRGDRQTHVRDMLRILTGAEDALVVNNAAAAILLALRALAFRKEVLISRGQMVEIGGSFRVPDIARQTGCRLIEVGSTNKTHLHDYEVNDKTAAILVCHRSNFEIVGFTSEPSVRELAGLGVPVIDDMGTGCLVDLSQYGLPKTKTLADSIAQGASLAIGSGDKLLGGPQAGVVVGDRALIMKLKRHPLARALRVDKLTIAALSATLRLYIEDRSTEIPALRYLTRSIEEVRGFAERLANGIGELTIVEESTCEFGGGSGAGMSVPSFRVGIKTGSPERLAKRLREAEPGVVGRIQNGTFWLDPRTAETDEVDRTIAIVRECLQ